MKKAHKLSSYEISQLFRKARCYSSAMANVYIDSDVEGPKWAVASRKKLGNAVKRNRAKRLLREYASYVSKKMDKKRIFLVAKDGILNFNLTALKKILDEKLKSEFQ